MSDYIRSNSTEIYIGVILPGKSYSRLPFQIYHINPVMNDFYGKFFLQL